MGNRVETFCFGVPVVWVLFVNFGVTIDVIGHDVWTAVPHGFVIHTLNAVNAESVNQTLVQWSHAVVWQQGVEVWFFSDAVVDNGGSVRNFDANHFEEFRTFGCVQSTSFFFSHSCGHLVVFFCTFDHFHWHGSVVGQVFMMVQNPFKTGSPVLSSQICGNFFVNVTPFQAFTDFNSPGQTAVFGTPFGSQTRDQLTVTVGIQCLRPYWAQTFCVSCRLGVQYVEGNEFSGSQFTKYEVGDFFFCRCSWSRWSCWSRGGWCGWCGWGSRGGWSFSWCGRAASGQHHSCSHSQCQNFRQAFSHNVPPISVSRFVLALKSNSSENVNDKAKT